MKKYEKYVDMYGYGIKDANFNNYYGDKYILVMNRSGLFSTRKSSSCWSSSIQFVRFITEEDAQNFIDNYLKKDDRYNSKDYISYKIVHNRECILKDEKWHLYVTTEDVHNFVIRPAIYDKKGDKVRKALKSLKDIDITELYNLFIDSTKLIDNKHFEYFKTPIGILIGLNGLNDKLEEDVNNFLKYIGLKNREIKYVTPTYSNTITISIDLYTQNFKIEIDNNNIRCKFDTFISLPSLRLILTRIIFTTYPNYSEDDISEICDSVWYKNYRYKYDNGLLPNPSGRDYGHYNMQTSLIKYDMIIDIDDFKQYLESNNLVNFRFGISYPVLLYLTHNILGLKQKDSIKLGDNLKKDYNEFKNDAINFLNKFNSKEVFESYKSKNINNLLYELYDNYEDVEPKK